MSTDKPVNRDRKDTKGKINYLGMPKSAFKARHVIEQEGIAKYGNAESWKENEPAEGVRKYLNALMSHIQSHNDGEEIDPDGGNPHIYKILWNAIAVVYHYERLVASRPTEVNAQIYQYQPGQIVPGRLTAQQINELQKNIARSNPLEDPHVR